MATVMAQKGTQIGKLCVAWTNGSLQGQKKQLISQVKLQVTHKAKLLLMAHTKPMLHNEHKVHHSPWCRRLMQHVKQL